MRSLILGLFALVGVGEALAHNSVVAHEHPHEMSMLPGLELLVVPAVIASFAWLLWRHFKRG